MDEFARKMLYAFKEAGVAVTSSVPDTWITPLLSLLDGDAGIAHVSAAREEDALGVCCGAALSGDRSVLLIQNSGALNCGGAFSTFTSTYGIPIVLLVADRGQPGDITTGHFGKSRAFRPYLEAMQIPHFDLTPNFDQTDTVGEAFRLAELSQKPVALLITQATLKDTR
jgi:sulfopyruvate decarboxylase subunit alpha